MVCVAGLGLWSHTIAFVFGIVEYKPCQTLIVLCCWREAAVLIGHKLAVTATCKHAVVATAYVWGMPDLGSKEVLASGLHMLLHKLVHECCNSTIAVHTAEPFLPLVPCLSDLHTHTYQHED